MDETKQPGITISQVYLANARFGHIENALAISPTTPIGDIATVINVQVGMSTDEDKGFCSVTVASDPTDSKSLYQFHVEMVLVVEAGAAANLPVKDYLMKAGAPTLYPFIRETLASMTGKGRFGALWLPPFNFSETTENLRKEQVVTNETNKPRA